MQGDVLVDIPLSNVIDQHNLNDNSMTVVLKEIDLAQKPKFKGGEVPETYDIFGLSDFSNNQLKDPDSESAASGPGQLRRVVFKTNSATNSAMPLNVKASLLRKCHSMIIRTDLADAGLYICKYWIVKLLEDLEKDHEIEHSSLEDELITFLALNQYKKKLAKYVVKPKHEPKLGLSSSSYQAKINMIMNPKAIVNKDVVKLAAFIDNDKENYFQKFHNLKYYMASNQDA